MGWRAWYADGQVFQSTTHSVNDLPPQGLQVVVVYLDKGYREMIHGEFVYHHEGYWRSALSPSEAPAGSLVFPGSLMSDPEWEWLQDEAMKSLVL